MNLLALRKKGVIVMFKLPNLLINSFIDLIKYEDCKEDLMFIVAVVIGALLILETVAYCY